MLTLPAEERATYFTRFNQGQAGTLPYYRLLADSYKAARGQDVLERPRLQVLFTELGRTVAALEEACGVKEEEILKYPLLRRARGVGSARSESF